MSDSRAASLRALLFASSAAGMLVAAPAMAADAADLTVAADQQQPANLGTIDVNGHVKKPAPVSPEFVAPLVDTPRAVTVIPQAIIEQTAASSLQDLLSTAPVSGERTELCAGEGVPYGVPAGQDDDGPGWGADKGSQTVPCRRG